MATARRRGCLATGPPSWKTSSVRTATLRIGKSGMGKFLPFMLVGRGEHHGSIDAGLTAKKQRRGGDQAAPAKIFGDGKAVVQRPRHLAGRERSDALRHQPVAEIAVG